MKRSVCTAGRKAPAILFLVLPLVAAGQSLQVYSEFQRIGPQGKVIRVDRAATSREILSPAVARNAYASFHVAVSMPPGKTFTLYIGQNPDQAAKVDLYREVYVKNGNEWIPDGLEPAPLPYTGIVASDATTAAFWLDLWVSAQAVVQRIKVEPQLYFDERWITYPMEVRIKEARVPVLFRDPAGAARIPARADANVRDSLFRYLCGDQAPKAQSGPRTVRSLIARNAAQDMALAQKLETRLGRERVVAEILTRLEAADASAWCAAPVLPAKPGPEWYLKIRDFLFRAWD